MGYISRVQIIQRANNTRQFYLICPAPFAEAMELEKGEQVEWVIQDKYTIEIRRERPAKSRKGETHER